MKFYGSLDNRLEENKMYTNKIEIGTGMTEYSWSDRKPYEVVEVDNQKHVWVRAMDYKKAENSVPMDNNWELFSNENNSIQELVYRYNHWNWVIRTGPKTFYRKTNVSFGVAEYYYDYSF